MRFPPFLVPLRPFRPSTDQSIHLSTLPITLIQVPWVAINLLNKEEATLNSSSTGSSEFAAHLSFSLTSAFPLGPC
jgi:hypothetical protein